MGWSKPCQLTVQVAVLLAVAVAMYAAVRVVRLLSLQVGLQADAVIRAVELGQAQRRDAARPVLAVAVRSMHFPGIGPAIRAIAYHADDDMDGKGTVACCWGPAGRPAGV
jgi:hypothetical protein